MAEVSLEFIQSQLQSIQHQLRDIKSTVDLDRRNARSMYDNLAAEMTRGISDVNARIDAQAELIDDRFNHLVELIQHQAGLIQHQAELADSRFNQLVELISNK